MRIDRNNSESNYGMVHLGDVLVIIGIVRIRRRQQPWQQQRLVRKLIFYHRCNQVFDFQSFSNSERSAKQKMEINEMYMRVKKFFLFDLILCFATDSQFYAVIKKIN